MTNDSRITRAQTFLRPIVNGGNDGIVTTFAIVAGFAGAQSEGAVGVGLLAVLVFGCANLVADAVSMGLGEYLSGRSQIGLYRTEHRRELEAIRANPLDANRALARVLERRGLHPGDARTAAGLLAQSPDLAAELQLLHVRGVDTPSLANPAINGLWTAISFVSLGVIPLLPFLIWPDGTLHLRISFAATALALFALGFLRGLASGERLLRAIIETLLVGGVCAVIAYGVGALVATV